MTWVAVAVGGAAVVGAAASTATASNASSNAAAAQQNAAGQANQISGAQYADTVARNAPYTQAGQSALGALSNRLGLTDYAGQPLNVNAIGNQSMVDASSGGFAPNQQLYTSDPAYKQAFDEAMAAHQAHFGQAPSIAAGSDAAQFSTGVLSRYQQLNPQSTGATSTAGAAGSTFGSLLKPFTGADLTSEPGYQFGLNQGTNALSNSMAAKGGLYSGAAGKALDRYTQDYAGTKYGEAYNRYNTDQSNQYNRLMGITGLGQSSANQTNALGAANATQTGSNLAAGANAFGAGQIGTANALTSGVSTGLNFVQQQQYLNQLQQQNALRQTQSGYATPIGAESGSYPYGSI